MRGRRCNSCGERFYVLPGSTAKECQSCSGDHDPSDQEARDEATLEAVNDIRNLSSTPQTVDIMALAEAAAAPPKKTRKASDDTPQS
jgi:hypothetical protein